MIQKTRRRNEMKCRQKRGFSLLDVLSAVVILVVVALATVATVAPDRPAGNGKLADQELALLNESSQRYFQEMGRYPAHVHQLAAAGYLADRIAEDPAQLTRMRRTYSYSSATGVFGIRAVTPGHSRD